MNIKFRTWCLFLLLALVAFAAWFKFSYPQFSFIDFTVSKNQALEVAKEYLVSRGINPERYRHATVFISDGEADRYLQKTLGFKGERDFIKKHDFDLFLWLIRFFRENEKEEFRLTVSAKTKEVTTFQHTIDDTEARQSPDDEKAKIMAMDFLKKTFNVDFNDYTFHSKQSQKYDNRTDHAFTWEKNGVYVPWSKEPDSGGGKVLMGATVSGNEIRSFAKNKFEIPDKFSRAMQKQMSVGGNLSMVFFIIYLALISTAAFFVILRRNHLAMHVAKNFFITVTALIFLFNIASNLNEFEYILYGYDTTTSMKSYLLNYALQLVVYVFLATIAILMPGLAGESLHREQLPQKKEGSFLHYIVSSFFSRNIASLIFLGYLVAIIMMGLQSLAFQFGQKYLGVWVEYTWLTQISSTYLPFLSAFIIGFKASMVEEVIFRIFAINLFKKMTGSLLFAVILSSLIWGYGHSNYLIFPMWFRGLEVGTMGMFLSYVYLRFGIIPVLIAHYVFDVFWNTAGFLLGNVTTYNFFSSFCVLILPMLWAALAYVFNKPEQENELRWRLNKHQLYNLDVLASYLHQNQRNFISKPQEDMRKELISHGWDVAVVDAALRQK